MERVPEGGEEPEVQERRSPEVNRKTEEEEAMEDQLFEAVSKRAWTDICLQILKVRPHLFICYLLHYSNARLH